MAFGSARSVGSRQEEPATRRLVRGRQPAAAAAPIAVDARGARVATCGNEQPDKLVAIGMPSAAQLGREDEEALSGPGWRI